MVNDHEEAPPEREEGEEAHERIALPLLIPAIVFLFALLVIYGLSRIFLELSDFEIGGTTMATPLAIGVALAILGVAWYFAANPRLSQWVVASIVLGAVALLTGGAIIAAVHDEGEKEHVTNGGVVTPSPTAAPGTVLVELGEQFTITLSAATVAAGTVTFSVTNTDAIFHNFRVIRTDNAPDDLPVDDGAVDEGAVEVVDKLADFGGGETETLPVDLEAGNYVLICNVPSHYEAGMRAALTVE